MRITSFFIIQALTSTFGNVHGAREERKLSLRRTERSTSGPTKAGDIYDISISSNYEESEIKAVTSEDGKTDTYSLSYPDASYISVHFSSFDLPPSCSLTLSDGKREQRKITLTGKGKFDLGTFWARHVKGDRVDMSLFCDRDRELASFQIDQFAAGYSLEEKSSSDRPEKEPSFLEDVGVLSICGTDDKLPAKCYQDSEPTVYGKARAVARLLINGSSLCTGWLVSGDNRLFTNEHCVDSLSDVQNTDFEFMYETTSCESGSTGQSDIYSGSALLALSAQWDYALIQLDGNPAALYGYLQLDNRKPPQDEEIYIPQHPGGRRKELGVYDTNHEGYCKVKSYGGGCSPEDMRYTCDTEGGSSGSPVLSRTNHKVVALHHCGGACNGNLGAPIYRFYDDIKQFLGEGPPTASPTPGPPTAAPTPCANGSLKVSIQTDNYPQEVSWTLSNGCNGEELMSGDSYTSQNTLYEHEVCAPASPSDIYYDFTIEDSYGDGLGWYDGWYKVYYNGVEYASGEGNFGSEETKLFGNEDCGSSTDAPTASPTAAPTSSPTVAPTTSPTSSPTANSPPSNPTDSPTFVNIEDCTDSPLDTKLEITSGMSIPYKCNYLKKMPFEPDCPAGGVMETHCPMACGKCGRHMCSDSTGTFFFKGNEHTCDTIPEKHCNKNNIKMTCRSKCNYCAL